jgi:hypothetical protein
MMRSVIALGVLSVGVTALVSTSATHVRGAEPDEGLYRFVQVEGGYLRLDPRSGQVSLCSQRAAGWSCLAVPDDRTAYDGEIGRLQNENAALRRALLERGLPLPGGTAVESPSTQGGESRLGLPSDADIHRMMTAVEKAWRRLVEIFVGLQKDMMNRT